MAVARDDLGRAARKRGIEGQVTIIRHFGIRCMLKLLQIFIHAAFIKQFVSLTDFEGRAKLLINTPSITRVFN